MQKLDIEYDFDFDLIGISSSEKGYKLAWLLNQKLHISLVKAEDLQLDFNGGAVLRLINYHYQTANNRYRLIRNRAVESEQINKPYLIPELEGFDFFLMLENNTKTIDLEEVCRHLGELKEIQYLMVVNVDQLKSKDNLIFFEG
jgi:hypothetical protein